MFLQSIEIHNLLFFFNTYWQRIQKWDEILIIALRFTSCLLKFRNSQWFCYYRRLKYFLLFFILIFHYGSIEVNDCMNNSSWIMQCEKEKENDKHCILKIWIQVVEMGGKARQMGGENQRGETGGERLGRRQAVGLTLNNVHWVSALLDAPLAAAAGFLVPPPAGPAWVT